MYEDTQIHMHTFFILSTKATRESDSNLLAFEPKNRVLDMHFESWLENCKVRTKVTYVRTKLFKCFFFLSVA